MLDQKEEKTFEKLLSKERRTKQEQEKTFELYQKADYEQKLNMGVV